MDASVGSVGFKLGGLFSEKETSGPDASTDHGRAGGAGAQHPAGCVTDWMLHGPVNAALIRFICQNYLEFSIRWFTSHMVVMARAVTGGSQDPEASSRCLTLARDQALELSPATSQGAH